MDVRIMEVLGTNVVEDLKYTKTSEWAKVEGDVLTIGLTDYAQHELTDIVFVELPEVGAMTAQFDAIAVVESVKAAADFYAPVSGEVVEVNEALIDQPELLNTEPYGEGWMFKIKMSDTGELDNLMEPAAYCAHVEAEHKEH
jgi:glycine cleavage system H protein